MIRRGLANGDEVGSVDSPAGTVAEHQQAQRRQMRGRVEINVGGATRRVDHDALGHPAIVRVRERGQLSGANAR